MVKKSMLIRKSPVKLNFINALCIVLFLRKVFFL